MKTIILIFSLVLLSACASTLLTPTQTDVDRGVDRYPEITLNSLNHGKMIYEKQCGNCHSLKKVKSRDEAGWSNIVPKMVQKANKRTGKVVINEEDQKTLLQYLITMSET